MQNTQFDVLAGALDDVGSALEEHIVAVTDLVGELEATERLRSSQRVQLERLDTLLATTRQLCAAVRQQREILKELRVQLASLRRTRP